MKLVIFKDKESGALHGGIQLDDGSVICGCCGSLIEADEIGPEENYEVVEELPWISLDKAIMPCGSDTFGEVLWGKDDIETALLDSGYAATQEQIDAVFEECDSHDYFTDSMIEAGWQSLNQVISEVMRRLDKEIY